MSCRGKDVRFYPKSERIPLVSEKAAKADYLPPTPVHIALFVIAEWDRATRSMMDGIKIIQRIADRGASIRVLHRQWLDLTTPMGKGILAFFSAMAEDERQRIVTRANDGRQAAKAQRVKFRHKPKLSDHQQQVVKERLVNGDSVRSIALDFGVARATISRLK